MSVVVQPFRESDLEAVDGVLRSAFKNTYDRKDNLKRYLTIQSCCSFVAKIENEVVGFGAAMDYGPFAYIGKMGVDPSTQRRGIGGGILTMILRWLQGRKCPTFLLDASQYGGPLYEKFDFLETDLTAVMQQNIVNRTGERMILNRAKVVEFSKLLSFDMPRFGADRLQLLRSYFEDDSSRFLVSHDGKGQVDGFLVAQPRVIGPWVSKSVEVAEALLEEALQFSFLEKPTVFVSASNESAVELLSRHGFEKLRTQRHMARGKKIQRDRKGSIYGQANFSFG